MIPKKARAILLVLLVAMVVLQTFPTSGFAMESTPTVTNEENKSSSSQPNFAPTATSAATVNGTSYETIQEAIDAVHALPTPQNSTTYVIEIADGTYDENLGIIQEENKNLILVPAAGATVIFTNTLRIDGNQRLHALETLRVENITFDFSGSTAVDCIKGDTSLTPTGTDSMMHNVTVKGCRFLGRAGASVVGFRPGYFPGGGSYNITFDGCYSDSAMHSLAQIQDSGGNFLFRNCEIYSSAGINFTGMTRTVGGDASYYPSNLVIDNCIIEVTKYAVRVGGGDTIAVRTDSTLQITDSVLKSNSAASDEGTVVLRGDAPFDISIINSAIKNTAEGGAVLKYASTRGEEGSFAFELENNYWGPDGLSADVFAGFGNVPLLDGITTYGVRLSFNASGGVFADGEAENEVQATVTIATGISDATFPEAPLRQGYTFRGWSVDGVNVLSEEDLEALSVDSEIYALWTEDEGGSVDATNSVTPTTSPSGTLSGRGPNTGDSGIALTGTLALILSAVTVSFVYRRRRAVR